ncbi:tetratricopeptide repeat-containing diguanylate cyclase [Mangrovihabitans endophyticus]|uniref:GGDEF domain-containing protein n=1 Tax=Mangrovihabitans endophyticus TaxID=1751298 RepID=A0A8J3FR20_9ACTN|nr:GGDEF domain-containing protein [Mangrovihabitans endophyticus]GGL05632.1 hypothetical protein GCM10012284_45080 [Mangrovihabitans endophyticus]
MEDPVDDAEQLSVALLEIEDAVVWDAVASLDRAVVIEQQALRLGDEMLAARARLCQANMWMRSGDVATAARQISKIHQWAIDHDARRLQARTHLVWANIHRHLGDAAQCLEHSVLAVELLDDQATPHMQIWHRTKLADALGLNNSLEAARQRYAQAEGLAYELDQPDLLIMLLNNWAYCEYSAGAHEGAEEVASRLQALAARHGHQLEPNALDTIGSIQIENGHFAEAERTLQIGIARYGEGRYEDADALPEYLLTLAQAQRGLGATDRAQQSLDRSRALCLERDLGDVLVRVQQEQAELHAARGEFAEAFAAHKVFFASFKRLQSQQREAQARTRQAMFEADEALREAERFREQARRDPLTGLRNRRFVDEELPRLLDASESLTVAIVDLDHFKRINDQLSHDVGDQVLVQVAKVLETELTAVAPDGFVARLGGEEFLMVLPGATLGVATVRLDGIRRAVGGYEWNGITRGLPVTVSVGAADLYSAPAPTQADLLSIADRNLYAAKRAGRDRVISAIPEARHLYRDGASAA